MRRRQAAGECKLDEATVQVILSDLVGEGILQAQVRVRCPYCNTGYGTYERQSDVPDEMERCFNCENEFAVSSKRNWEVIYEVTSDPGDFFRDSTLGISYFLEEDHRLPAEYFDSELGRLRKMDDEPTKRGREFDVFMGLLFQQLEGVEVRLKRSGNSGEVDVHMVCLDAPEWVVRLFGSHTLVENKWEQNPVQKREISVFHAKASEISSCERSYFVSMSGFSRRGGKSIGALPLLRSKEDPPIVDFWKDDVEDMVEAGTPELVLRERLLG